MSAAERILLARLAAALREAVTPPNGNPGRKERKVLRVAAEIERMVVGE